MGRRGRPEFQKNHCISHHELDLARWVTFNTLEKRLKENPPLTLFQYPQ